jgi:hypothetical protein
MAEKSFKSTLLSLAKTSPAERQRYMRLSTLFCDHVAATQPEGLAEGLRPFLQPKPAINRPAVGDVEMTVDVEIVPGLKNIQDQYQVTRFGKELLPTDASALAEVESKIVSWLAEKPERAAEFLTNPLGALEKSGLGIDPKLLGRLRAARWRKFQAVPLIPLHVSKITVTALKG